MASDRVSDEIVGFHCQQAAEKLLKGLLSEVGAPFRRTHNLAVLMDALTDAGHPLPTMLAELDRLTPYGTLLRYEDVPVGASLDRGMARGLIRALREHVERRVLPDVK